MAFQVGSTCYASAAQAVAASVSAQVGAVVTHGGAAYVVAPSVSTGGAVTYNLTPVAGGPIIQSVVQLEPMPCGLLDWQDGLTLGWLVAGAWLAVAAVMFMRRGVHL